MMALFQVEDILSPLHQIHQRMNEVLLHEIPSSSASSHRSPTHTYACRRPFILHRNQWLHLLQAYSRVLSHIADVLSSILQAPLEALFSAMASAEASLAECVAPHIREPAAFDKSLSSRNGPNEAQSSAGSANNRLHDDHDDTASSGDDDYDDDDGEDDDDDDLSETADLTEDQLAELQHWMAQKALKHALSMEVPCLHFDNLLTSSIAVHEALSNYSVSGFATDILFHRDLAEEILHGEAAEKQQVSTSRWHSLDQAEEDEDMASAERFFGGKLRTSRRQSFDEAEDEDMPSAERFFGGKLRKRIGNSSPSIIALAEFVLQRLREGWDPATSTAVSATESFAHLVVDEAQFSAVIVDGEKAIVGRGATGTVVLKKWMVDDHIVAVKEVEMATGILELDDDVHLDKGQLQQLQGIATEIATQARVRHPNVLPLLCCTQALRKYDHMVPNVTKNLGSSSSSYMFPVFNPRKVLGLAMERMFFDLEKLIKLRKDRIHRRHRRSAAGAAIVAAPPPFPLHVAVDIMLQIAKGMEYLHRHHIMHRDLKPANILITPDSVIPPNVDDDDDRRLSFRVKVADFGISKSGFNIDISSMGHTANVGTGVWRAPEVMRDDEEDEVLLARSNDTHRNHVDEDTAKYSTKADVYSFAMVCYHILTGKVPFDGDRSRALRRKIRRQHLRPEFDMDQMNNSPSMSCPMALVDMIGSCWHRDTSARPNFTQIVNFLRYMKVCAVQMMRAVDGYIDDHRQRLQKLLGTRLFRIFQSKRLWEMRVESRRILVELEMGLSRDASTSSGANQSNGMTTAARTDVTNLNESSSNSGWTDSNRRRGNAGFIAKIFKAGRPIPSPIRTPSPADRTIPSPTDDDADALLLSRDVVSAFTRADIIKITANFSTKIRRTGFTCLYKGTLPNGTRVAVKAFESSHDRSTFYNEVALLSRTHHRNLVRLIGYCTRNSSVLVFEYVANGSLHDILHGDQSASSNLCWRDRLKIIKGIAQGINYLHNHCTPTIIHWDIKPGNILITEDMEAKIRGFGLSRTIYKNEEDGADKEILGTPGYIDPQLLKGGKVTKKVDIYSFGISMLEIISGRSGSCFFHDEDDENLFFVDEWVQERLERNEFSEIVDPNLLKSWNNNSSSIRHVLNIAITCVNQASTNRPTIEEIISDLN